MNSTTPSPEPKSAGQIAFEGLMQAERLAPARDINGNYLDECTKFAHRVWNVAIAHHQKHAPRVTGKMLMSLRGFDLSTESTASACAFQLNALLHPSQSPDQSQGETEGRWEKVKKGSLIKCGDWFFENGQVSHPATVVTCGQPYDGEDDLRRPRQPSTQAAQEGSPKFTTVKCPDCNGTGRVKIYGPKEPCPVCGGMGTLTTEPPTPASAPVEKPSTESSFQAQVKPWLLECFGSEIANDKVERNDRFIEESLELVQSCGYSAERAHALVDYVFSRPKGEPNQECGGVMVTLAALCLANGLDMHEAGYTELTRIFRPEVISKIRAKQAAKPTGSALPTANPSAKGAQDDPYKRIFGVSMEAQPIEAHSAGAAVDVKAEAEFIDNLRQHPNERIAEAERLLANWIQSCFCTDDSKCLMCETREFLVSHEGQREEDAFAEWREKTFKRKFQNNGDVLDAMAAAWDEGTRRGIIKAKFALSKHLPSTPPVQAEGVGNVAAKICNALPYSCTEEDHELIGLEIVMFVKELQSSLDKCRADLSNEQAAHNVTRAKVEHVNESLDKAKVELEHSKAQFSDTWDKLLKVEKERDGSWGRHPHDEGRRV